MNPETGKKFLACLGIHHPSLKNGEWLIGSCPLSRWTHKSGHDSNPSFALKVAAGEKSHFHCFACESGSAKALLNKMLFHAQRTGAMGQYDFKTAFALEEGEEVEVLPLPEFSEFGQPSQQKFEEWPDYFVDSFLSADAYSPAFDYLLGRGVTAQQVADHRIGYDGHRKMVVFPYWDVYGRLAGARGRSILKDPEQKHHDYKWNGRNNAKLVWYNETAMQPCEPIVVVEGQIDALRVEQTYPYVVANLTAKPVEEKLRKLQQLPAVVLIPDNDETGEASVAKYATYCDRYGIDLAVVTLNDAPRWDGKPGSANDPAEANLDWLSDQLHSLGLQTL